MHWLSHTRRIPNEYVLAFGFNLHSIIFLRLFCVLHTPTVLYFQLFCPTEKQTLEQLFFWLEYFMVCVVQWLSSITVRKLINFVKGKGKVHPCIDTEAPYRPYRP